MTNEIRNTTARIISQLYRGGELDKAVLASARNAATITSPRAQAVWPLMMANLDQKMLSHNGVPTRAENAVYTAIRLYAIHQQGLHDQCAYAPVNGTEVQGQRLFSALAKLRKREGMQDALDRRVQPLLATTNVGSVINELVHLVSILKSKDRTQPIDYAQLAQDLYWFQMDYEHANQVRLQWGQQYFWMGSQVAKNEGESKND